MSRQTLRLGFASLLASVAFTSIAQAQIELNDSKSGVMGTLRPQSALKSGATQSVTTAVPLQVTPQPAYLVSQQQAGTAVPPAGDAAKPSTDIDRKDGTGTDDEVKSAAGAPAAAATGGSEAGRLDPITMESVRAPIGAANISVSEIGTKVLPEDQAAKQMVPRVPLPGGQDRMFSGLTYRWQAANICHFPLYFEEPLLERHGQQCCPTWIQPAVSGSKFLSNLVLYPYKATLHPAFENRYTLGHFRPGSGAPCLRDTLPWSTDAALVQAGAATAVVVGLPW